jgi:hypothetical protein
MNILAIALEMGGAHVYPFVCVIYFVLESDVVL